MSDDGEQNERLVEGLMGLPFHPASTELTIINVFEEFEVTSAQWTDIDSAEFYDEEDLPETILTSATRLDDAGYTVAVRREHGDPAEEIVMLAREADADMIAIAGRQRSPVGKAVFGSVTQGVLLSADRPVTVIPS